MLILIVIGKNMGALEGFRVLDLSRVLAGPWCGQILADLGAEVIKVERPKRGDDTRAWGPPWMKDDEGRDTHEAAYYQSTNRNKLSVAIDIATPEGQEVVRALALESDVVIENYKTGSLKKYGLDYETLSKLNPKFRIYGYSLHRQNRNPHRKQSRAPIPFEFGRRRRH